MLDGYIELQWRRRVSLDMEVCQLSMLECKPILLEQRHGIMAGQDRSGEYIMQHQVGIEYVQLRYEEDD